MNIWTLPLYNVIALTVNPETFITKSSFVKIILTCQYLALLCIAASFRWSFVATFVFFLPFSFIENSRTVSRQDGWIAPSQLQGRYVWKFGNHLEYHSVKYPHSQRSFDKYNLIRLFIVTTCLASWLPRFLFTWGWPRSELQANFSLSYIHSVWRS